MLGSTRIGMERMAELLAGLGANRAGLCWTRCWPMPTAACAPRSRRCPTGEWEGEDGSDTDCFEERHVPVRVRMTKRGETLHVDFTGSAPQIAGFKNSSVANTHSAVYMAISSFFDPDMPRNEGTYRGVDHPRAGGHGGECAAAGADDHEHGLPAAEIVHACWKALAQAAPERACAGWGKTSYGLTSGPRSAGPASSSCTTGADRPAPARCEGRDGFH